MTLLASQALSRRPLAALRWRLAGSILSLKLLRLRWTLKAGFDPNQPRVPAGQADGGRWTGGGADGSFRVAQSAPRGGGGRSRSGGGRWSDATPAQQARLEISRSRAEAAIARVRRTDPTWHPRPGLRETIEGEIVNNQAIEREANGRYVDIQKSRAGIGPYAVEGIPGRGPYTRPNQIEKDRINKLGDLHGCHRCGRRTSGTDSGNWIYDHQGASALGGRDAGRFGYPHCTICRAGQGGLIRDILRYIPSEK